MLQVNELGAMLRANGFQWGVGVPCSYLESLINYASNQLKYLAAPNEGDAVAFASGTEVAGVRTAVLMQNSGLTNAVSPLTSLNYPFRIPVLGFVSLRGEPGLPDEPQHELTGRRTTQLLDLMDIRWEYLSDDQAVLQSQFQLAREAMNGGTSFFFVVRQNTLGGEDLEKREPGHSKNEELVPRRGSDELPTRYAVLKAITGTKDRQTAQIVTTGKSGRELFSIEDAPNNLYMVGSMGCASSFGLGVSLACTEKKVVVIDGDGACLMRMGNLAMVGSYSGPNCLHIVLDNGSYDSTGGQRSISGNVDLVAVAAACGYTMAMYVHSLDELNFALQTWHHAPRLTFLLIRVSPGSMKDLGRPTLKPHEVKERFKSFLRER